MKFNHILNEIQNPTLNRINSVVSYLNGQFKTDYPQYTKIVEAIRSEVLVYARKNGTYYGVQVICTTKSSEQERNDLQNTIKSLQIIKDNKAQLELNDKMMKILFREEPLEQQNIGVKA